MTFDDDFIQLEEYDVPMSRWPATPIAAIVPTPRVVRFRCKDIGVKWPPPDLLTIEDGTGRKWKRISMSAITDKQREGMSHVARGAAYERLKS